jgi:diacylglycerol kinase (ATP)
MVLKQRTKIIINPAAGSFSTYRKWPYISQLLRQQGLKFDFQHTEGVGHAIELARDAANNGYNYLIAVGGDGTVNEVANGILTTDYSDNSSMGIVNTGTGSDFTRSVHLPRDYVNACPCVVGQVRMKIDVGVAEFFKDGEKIQRYFVNAAGIGFDAEVAQSVSRSSHRMGGTIPYLVGLARKLFFYHNKDITLEIDGREEQKRVLSVVVANGRYFGGGMKVAPMADLSDGLLDVLTVGDFGKLDLIKTFPRIYKGTHITHPKVRAERASKVTVSSKERLLVQADGEVLGEGSVSFWLIPAALSIAV